MKIAVLADIHGNLHGLEAILADLERQEPDVVVCAGDICADLSWIAGPHPAQLCLWDRLGHG